MLSFRDQPYDFNAALDTIEPVTPDVLPFRLQAPEYAEFDAAEYERRYARLAALMRAEDIDAVVVTQEENLRYFTGYLSILWVSKFRPYIGILPASPAHEPALLVPQQERGNAGATSWIGDVNPFPAQEPPIPHVARKLRERDVVRVGIELGFGQRLGMNQQQLDELLTLLPDVEFVDATPLCQAVRMLKSDAEIARLEEANEISLRGVRAGWEGLRAGQSERELLSVIAKTMFEAGAEVGTRPSFFACSAGERFEKLGLANAIGSGYALRPGDYVSLDGGACSGGYLCDIIRQACLGEPRPEQRAWSDAVVVANEEAIAAIAPGVPAHAVYDAAMASFDALGVREHNFLTIVGHGVGLDIHELPWVGERDSVFTADTRLRAGMVLSIEPGLVARDGGGPGGLFIVEDMVVVTREGSRNLSSSLSKALWTATT